MANQHSFPHLQTSPNPSGNSSRMADSRSGARDTYRSLPHTPLGPRRYLSANPRNCWAAMRRDRQARVDSVLDAHAKNVAQGSPSPPREAAGARAIQDLPKLIRSRAREVGWMLGKRTKPKVTRLTPLAHALRSAACDEDDAIADALKATETSGAPVDPAAQSAEFEMVQEISALRQLLRSLLRIQTEHPDVEVRKGIDDLLARINSEKKMLKIPLPQPLATGPSFFFPAQKFALAAEQRFEEAYRFDDDSSSSSDEYSEYSDDEDDDGDNSPMRHTSTAASPRKYGGAPASRRGAGARRAAEQSSHAAHLSWVRNYAEELDAQWPNGTPHLFQLFNPIPQCGFAMSATFSNIFRVQRSSVKEAEAHYLFAAAAAQVECYPLVCLAESKMLVSCDMDEGDVYESWLTQGIAGANVKTQLLARFGAMLRSRPWHLAAQDVKRFVDEYVHLHNSGLLSVPVGRHRGDSNNSVPSSRPAVHRSLSTSVVSGGNSAAATLSGFSRKSIEDSAIRDLLHTIVVMAVAHGLGSFASACGITPDLDLAAGSFFNQADPYMAAETIPGLPHIPSSPLSCTPGQSRLLQQSNYLSPTFIEQVEKNTADLVSRLLHPPFPEGVGPDHGTRPRPGGYPAIQSQSPHQQSLPPPPASLLRHISGVESRTTVYQRSLVHAIDPQSNPSQQFEAYRCMRARKLAKYALPELLPLSCAAAQETPQQTWSSGASSVHFADAAGSELSPGCHSQDTPFSALCLPLEMAHHSALHLTQAPLHTLPQLRHQARNAYLHVQPQHPAACPPQPPSHVSQSHAHMSVLPAKSVDLSHREDLRWDVLSNYLRQQLSINDDHLGKELQAARGLTCRSFVDSSLTDVPQPEDMSVFLADIGPSLVKADAAKHEWDRSADSMPAEHSSDLKPKCYSLSNVFSISSSNPDKNLYPSSGDAHHHHSHHSHANHMRVTDARQFHDAVWHFTLSLYHIYEEYYFYNKYKDETTPESTQLDVPRFSAAYDRQFSGMPIPNYAYSASTRTASSLADTEMDVDMGLSGTPNQSATSPQQYNKWLSEDLKLHIRVVVRNPGAVSALTAQPPVATGLNLSIEEMVHVNLIVSLAQRQAEIIHGIRAIREYEESTSA